MPRRDGTFVPGKREFTIQANLIAVNGISGALKELLGAPLETLKGILPEYIKNVLRGRAAWGLKHRLTRKWAELPAQKRALTMAECMPRVAKRAANNARVPPLAEGAVGRSGPLFA